MEKERIHILDPKHGSKYHLMIPDSDENPILLCDSTIDFGDATIREIKIENIKPENTCTHCLRKALQKFR